MLLDELAKAIRHVSSSRSPAVGKRAGPSVDFTGGAHRLIKSFPDGLARGPRALSHVRKPGPAGDAHALK